MIERPNSLAPAASDSQARFLPSARKLLWLLPLALVCSYVFASYVAAPTFWRAYEKRHPALEQAQRRAVTALGIPGDPINFAFVGTQEELLQAAQAAGWSMADPITWGSSARIALDSVAHRKYDQAPVSDLFVWGKKQDLAFEQAFGPDPSKRHHVRFWRSREVDEQGRPLWLGAATFDSKVGLSHTTGQVTHHIDPDIDKERDKLAADLSKDSGLVLDCLEDFQLVKKGKNGGGDPYFTDGRLCGVRVVAELDPLALAQQFFAPVRDILAKAASARQAEGGLTEGAEENAR
jgi:hypothetical protein